MTCLNVSCTRRLSLYADDTENYYTGSDVNIIRENLKEDLKRVEHKPDHKPEHNGKPTLWNKQGDYCKRYQTFYCRSKART